jgi:hypothetical protein
MMANRFAADNKGICEIYDETSNKNETKQVGCE